MKKSTTTEIVARIASARKSLGVALRNLRGDRPLAALASLNIGIAEALRAQVAFARERHEEMLAEGIKACKAKRRVATKGGRHG